MKQPDWYKVSDHLRKQAIDMQKAVEREPAERGRAIGSAAMVIACLANAIDVGLDR